ncbi:3-dehydroquinate synthase [Inconstantimicrobium mannanitabidum]|uniref:3-dehydroquinate synthase n=1 Tax=Inconstantimicrobium mannanitabidum TaxID=1604901 RepID=A0ACB5R8B8_9CLOT|nr:3-dehydroquinate synthase [Clostridium sp. TW13]GKX65422.1 3-dehydroquinate synthase [Clostridium sp. TW13]
METIRVNLGDRSYNIDIEKGIRKKIGKHIKQIFKGKKIAIITDENVDSYYGNEVERLIKHEGYETIRIVLEPGEKTKSFNTLPYIYNELLKFKLTRSDLILTLGGGVIGDLGGFVAATFLRGIDFIQFPTSLLAQVDSSVGGKVAVDLEEGKNLIGAFHHPKAVFIDSEMLETLEEKFFSDGMAEVIKYGCILDKNLFDKLDSFEGREQLMEYIDEVIFTCCDIKRQIVERDERDTGERMILNFGHTLGHAIEKYFNYEKFTHGEGVALGMYEITKLSEKKGLTKLGTVQKIQSILQRYKLPYEIQIDEKEKIIEAISLDKKNLNNVLNLIILKEIGNANIIKESSDFFK